MTRKVPEDLHQARDTAPPAQPTLPAYLLASTQDASINWTLFQNSGAIQFSSVGVGDFGWPISQYGNEATYSGRSGYCGFRIKSSGIILTDGRFQKRLYGAALSSNITAKAITGKYTTHNGDSTTHHHQPAAANITAKTNIIYPRPDEEFWLQILEPASGEVDPKNFWQNYQLNIYNNNTGDLHKVLIIDETSLSEVGVMGNRFYFGKLSEEVPDDATGVPLGQSFRFEMVTQGRLQTEPWYKSNNYELFGSSIVWGILTYGE